MASSTQDLPEQNWRTGFADGVGGLVFGVVVRKIFVESPAISNHSAPKSTTAPTIPGNVGIGPTAPSTPELLPRVAAAILVIVAKAIDESAEGASEIASNRFRKSYVVVVVTRTDMLNDCMERRPEAYFRWARGTLRLGVWLVVGPRDQAGVQPPIAESRSIRYLMPHNGLGPRLALPGQVHSPVAIVDDKIR